VRNLHLLDLFRDTGASVVRAYGWTGDDGCGAFNIPSPIDRAEMRVVASTGIEWRPVQGYEDLYEVSNDGRVRALPKTVPLPNGGVRNHDQIELSVTHEHGYPRVTLCNGGSRTKPFVHVLVARAFIPNPRGFPEVNHKDFNKQNARVTNLEWCTAEYNQHHAIEAGVKNGLTTAAIERIRELLGQGASTAEIVESFKVGGDAVNKIRKNWIRDTNPDEPTGLPYDPFWDHVSVSRANRCPNWPEMEHVKRLFFQDTETAMQLHVPAADHINNHPYCLHLWRPHGVEIPRPPAIFVGVKPGAAA